MHLRCPHCKNPIELVDAPSAGEITCSSCGSNFRLDQASTTGWDDFIGKRIGKFQVIGTLGRGAFGIVLKARDEELDRTVAIKIPRPGNIGEGPHDLDRFLREARSVAQLQHPSIVAIHEVGQTDLPSPLGREGQTDLPSPGTPGEGSGVRALLRGMPYLVSDLVDGVTLTDLLTTRRPTFAESAKLIAQVAEALDHARRHGIVHRDIKPSNIMVRPDGSPCVMDFGLAKRDAGEITVTIDGQVLGTPAYMSPEQARGEGHQVDGKSDVYSLGVVLYQLLSGELPFRGNKNMLIYQVLHEDPRPPRRLNDKVPRDLETICIKCMEKEPKKRYATAQDLADDLGRFLEGRPIHARPVGRLEKAVRWARRNPALAASGSLTVVALLALALGGMWYVQREAQRTTEEALRQAAADRQAALREQAIKLALDHAEDARQVLQRKLAKPGGVFELLNHPENWKAQVHLAQAAIDPAEALLAQSSEPGPLSTGSSTGELLRKVDALKTLLAQDDMDRRLAVRLEMIRMDKATIADGKFNLPKAAQEYPKALARLV